MKRDRRRGFTLVELVIVIAVIAVLAAILIPTFMTVVEKSRYSADIQAARNMSTLTKTAAINGATDADGNDLDVNMTEPAGVVKFLSVNGYDLVPKTKKAAFWYNRATGDVQVIKNADMFTAANNNAPSVSGANAVLNAGNQANNAGINSNEADFKQDCLEALVKGKPSYVYIDQSPKNPVTNALKSIAELAPKTKPAEIEYFTKVKEMNTQFESKVTNNADLKEIFKCGTKDAPILSNALAHIEEFSPKTCYYVTSDGAYTSNNLNSDGTGYTANTFNFSRAMFSAGITNFGSLASTAPTVFKDCSMTFNPNKPIIIPASITTFTDDAMQKFDPTATIIINRKYTNTVMANSGCQAIIVDNTGAIQITYKNLKYNAFTYDQYGVRYLNYKPGAGDVTTDTSNYNSCFDSLVDFTGSLADVKLTGYSRPATIEAAKPTYKKAQSIYAVPNISIDGTKTTSGDVTLNPIQGTTIAMTFNYYSKNVGNLTIMYGSIISKEAVYKIQDIAYIKAVSTYTITRDSGSFFVVSDPLAGSRYYNLEGLTIEAVYTDNTFAPMIRQTDGTSKNDYEIMIENNKKIEKIYVKNSANEVILVQYV